MSSYKNNIAITLLLLTAFLSTVQARTILIMSGGGARGLSHIGVLKALEEHNIRPDHIFATSMGAIVGSLYACGYTPEEIMLIAETTPISDVIRGNIQKQYTPISQRNLLPQHVGSINFDSRLRPKMPTGLIGTQHVYSALAPYLAPRSTHPGGSFKDLPIPITVVATDLITGDALFLEEGDLTQAVTASAAVPIAFEPVSLGNRLLIDGGIRHNIPIISSMISPDDTLIIVDVTSSLLDKKQLTSAVQIGMQVVGISITDQYNIEISNPHIYIRPELSDASIGSFSVFEELKQIGYKAAQDALKEMSFTRSEKSVELIEPIEIRRVEVVGAERTNPKMIKRQSSIKEGSHLNSTNIFETLHNLYGTELYSNIHIHQTDSTLTIDVRERDPFQVMFGLRFDQYHQLESFVSPEFKPLSPLDISAKLYLQYGSLRQKYAAIISGIFPVTHEFRLHYALMAYISSKNIVHRTVEDIPGENRAQIDYMEQGVNKNGINFTLGWDLNHKFFLFTGILAENYRYQSSTEFIIPLADDTSAVKFYGGYIYDNMDMPEFPLEGREHTTVYSIVGTAMSRDLIYQRDESIERTITLSGKHSSYRTWHRITGGVSIRYHWADKGLSPAQRFNIGGSRTKSRVTMSDIYNTTSFSGIRENQIAADLALIGGLSLRYRPFKRPFYLSLYGDWGKATDYSHEGYHFFKDFGSTSPLGVEVEGAFLLPIGPIRFSWSSILLNGQELRNSGNPNNIFNFAIGHNF